MPSRRSLLSYVWAALAGGLLAVNRASARSATREFVGIDGWLNTDGPLTMAGLRGKVVLVEFCTYTCINWRRTLPYVHRWHSEYGPQGLQIIGVHTPEFGFERDRPNVESAIRELDVRYPIAQDNEFQTWDAWDNRAWPSFYVLDRDGQVRLVREGEGYAQEIEAAIRSLLGLARAGSREHPADDADLSRVAHTRDLFRVRASHAAGPRTVAPARRGSLRLHPARRSQTERVPTGWKLGARRGSAGPSLASRKGSRALLGGKAAFGRWCVPARVRARQRRRGRGTYDRGRHANTLHAAR